MKGDARTTRMALYLAYFISSLGNWMFRVGVLFAVYQSKEEGALGIAVLVLYVPIIVSSWYLAPLGDHFNRKATMIGIDLLRGIILVPLCFLNLNTHTAAVFWVVCLMSLSQPVFAGAQIGLLRTNVPASGLRDVLKTFANIDWLTNIIGTTLGALALSRFSFRDVIICDIATFVMSAVLIGLAVRSNGSAEGSRKGEAAGASLAARVPLLAAGTVLFLNLGAGVINIFPTLVTLQVYHLPVSTMGTVYLFNGVGALLGASLVPFVNDKIGLRTILVVSSFLIAISVFMMARFAGLTWSIVASTAMLFFGQIFGVSASTFIISRYRQEHSSKGNGIFQFFTFLGVALNGFLYLIIGKQMAFHTFLMLSVAAAGIAVGLAFINWNINKNGEALCVT
jgi:predicted MFS family arabinose efflux permease